MTLRPLPKKFHQQLESATREQLVQQIHELYDELWKERNPERPQYVCESCGGHTADRPQIVAREPVVMVYPPTCSLCRFLGLGENIPLSECSDNLRAFLLAPESDGAAAPSPTPESAPDTPKCDHCKGPAVYQCHCARCSREPDADGRFHCCSNESCYSRVIDKHSRVYGRAVVWRNL